MSSPDPNDLSALLNAWPYDPTKINARLITGHDGEPRIQVRLDLGILQMHVAGRPDGLRPHGYGSLLEMFEARHDEREMRGEAEKFVLSADDCRLIREEAVQYYHRYVALLVLEDFEGVVRDTTRNLRALDLCAKYAETEGDRTILEQFRPYITMMRSRALASQAIKDNEPKAAIHAIDEGLEALKRYFADAGQPQLFDQSSEVQMLRGMRDQLIPKLPLSQKSELRERLARALEQENYELAAILRDELRLLKE